MIWRLATRGSALAVRQSTMIADAVRAATGREVALVIVRTRGDEVTDRPLGQVGGKGLFTKEIEAALLAGDADFAVHSLKDLPTEGPMDLIVGAIPPREDPRDVVIGPPLDALPAGARVGTGSARREVQLRARWPHLEVSGLRGNVDTRIQKQRDGAYSAVILAAAGVRRLGREADIGDILDVQTMIPAPGQGALAVQCRAGDAAMRAALERLHDPDTALTVGAERAFLDELSGGCSVPAGCHASLVGDTVHVVAILGVDGRVVRVAGSAERGEAEALGRRLARVLRAGG